MSSMFKKKGAPAFKPKVPLGKARPAAPRASQPPKPVAEQIASEPVAEQPPQDTHESPRIEKEPETSTEHTPPQSREAHTEPPATERVATPPSSLREPSAPPEPPKGGESELVANEDGGQDGGNDLPSIEAISAAQDSTTEPRIEPIQTPTEPPAQLPHQPVASVSVEPQAPEPSEEEATSNTPRASIETQATVKAKPRAKPAPRKKNAPADGTEVADARKRPTRKRKAPATELTEDGSEAAAGAAAAPRRSRKRRSAEVSAETSEDGTPMARSRRTRSATPEDAEDQTVDLQQLKMADLTRDLRIGKKFSRHDELREREHQKKIKAQLRKKGLLEEDEEENEEQRPSGQKTSRNGTPSSNQDEASAAGPQFRIVDGQIVLDQSSLVMDRHARAAAEQEDMEIIEENDFSRQITSNSYMNTSKLRKGNNWNEADTEMFYRGLRMFGTDFEMISKMFKNKVRREVKLKFNREERHNPKAIDAALIGEKSVKMDIDEYKKLSSSNFESVESIEAEQRKIQEDYEAERQRIADEQAEVMRKKREALFADDKGEGDGEGQAGKKKKKKSKKQLAQDQGLYGDEEVIVE